MNIQDFLSSAISFEDMPNLSNTEKAEQLKKSLYSEGCFDAYNLKRYGTYQNCLSNHLQGLPSYINIPFYYCDIIELAKKLGSLPEKSTEKQENKICTNYWNYMAAKLIQWAKKHKVNLF
jgi:hypothetical protein